MAAIEADDGTGERVAGMFRNLKAIRTGHVGIENLEDLKAESVATIRLIEMAIRTQQTAVEKMQANLRTAQDQMTKYQKNLGKEQFAAHFKLFLDDVSRVKDASLD